MMTLRSALSAAVVLLGVSFTARAQMLPQANPLRRFPAAEANQGVAVDDAFFYAIADHDIGKYRKSDGVKVAEWHGAPPNFIHINSCTALGEQLVCAHSNFPGVPQMSSVELFRRSDLLHVGSKLLGHGPGSLVWGEWHDNAWYACFANYDAKGGEPGHDHTATVLVRYDKAWTEQQRWLFPTDVLAKFGHMSASGGRFGADGLLYVQGHDLPEMYVLRVPPKGDRLEHVSTFGMPTGGQAFDLDRTNPRHVWSISRKGNEVVESETPALETEQR